MDARGVAPGQRRLAGGAVVGRAVVGLRTLILLLPLLAAGCAGDGGASRKAHPEDDYAIGIDSKSLVGLAPSQVTDMLGPADFRRNDGPAQILQYRSSTCVLDLFLYRAGGGDEPRVTYIEAHDRALAQMAPQACLASVVRGRRAGQASG
jgi:hypothetical protein